jgi:hypothetical protein
MQMVLNETRKETSRDGGYQPNCFGTPCPRVTSVTNAEFPCHPRPASHTLPSEVDIQAYVPKSANSRVKMTVSQLIFLYHYAAR